MDKEKDIKPTTMSADEAATYLGVSKWLVLDLVRKKKIPAIHAGKRVLFRKETLDTWMRNQEMQSVNTEYTESESGYGSLRRVKG